MIVHPKFAYQVNFCSELLEIVRVLLLVVLPVEQFREHPQGELSGTVESEKENRAEERNGHPGFPEESVLAPKERVSRLGVVAANKSENGT